jgi:cytochrome c
MWLKLSTSLKSGMLTAVLFLAALPVLAAEEDLTQKGEAILSEHCARCHAIGTSGESPNEEAPPLRVLSENYPVDDLAESLAEGIMSGHPDMPVFVFEPQEVEAILVYLRSIQVSPDPETEMPGSPDPADAKG